MRALVVILVLIAVLVVTVRFRAASREAAYEAAHPPVGQFLEVNGQRLHAHMAGSGPDLVIVHGASGNILDWLGPVHEALTQDFRVTIFDRPGHGYSARAAERQGVLFGGAETPADQAHLLADAAKALGIERPIVLGQSYGGSIALAWAIERPEEISGLVMVSGTSNPWAGPLDRIYRVNSSPWGAAIVVPLISAFAPEGAVSGAIGRIFAPDAAPEGYADTIGARLALRRSALRANARQIKALRPNLRKMIEHYAAIDVPTEILHGTADTIVGLETHSERLVTQIPKAVLTRLDGTGHMPHHATPEAVADAARRAAHRAGLPLASNGS